MKMQLESFAFLSFVFVLRQYGRILLKYIVLFYGFTAKVLYGPKFEPFARITLHNYSSIKN